MEIKTRIILILGLLAAIGSTILWQAFRLQVLNQTKKGEVLKFSLPPKRGIIYDRNGEVLAITLNAPSVYACPCQIEDPYKTAIFLSKALHLKSKILLKRLKSGKNFVWIKRWVSDRELKRIRGLKGIGIQRENRRYYPNGPLAGQVLGFVGFDGYGLEGVERQFDNYLRGKSGYYYGIKDARGKIIISPKFPFRPAEDGYNLFLTLDHRIQYAVEEALARVIKKWHAKAGYAVIIEPHTGEVLALANYPRFNPNNFRRARAKDYRNHVITDTFEPGSTFKPILAAAALDRGVLKPYDIIYAENGRYRIDDAIIHDVKPFKWLSAQQVIVHSSNIGAVKIGEILGKKAFYEYIKRFGFGQKTGIDLGGESNGLLRPVTTWKRVDAATICFGQGISVTALQLATAYAAIANGGKLIRPFVVKRIVDNKGKIVKVFKPKIRNRVISERTAKRLREILREVVLEGTGKMAEIEGYEIAGKTGTAQKPKNGYYQRNKAIASFVGFFPASDPKVVIAIIIDEPRPIRYGGIVAAPAFREVALDIIWKWHLSPCISPIEMTRILQSKQVAKKE